MEDTQLTIASLKNLLNAKENIILQQLTDSKPRLFQGNQVPQFRKELFIILTRIAEIHRMLANKQLVDTLKPEEIDIYQMLNKKIIDFKGDLDLAANSTDWLECVLIRIGDEQYIRTLLLNESISEENKKELPWSQFLPREELNALLEIYGKDKPTNNIDSNHRNHAIESLTYVSHIRGHLHHRHTYAKLHLKNIFFRRLAITLCGLSVSLATCLYFLFIEFGDKNKQLLLIPSTLFAGALGSVITGVFKVRDHLNRITDLRLFGDSLIVQPFIGAASGLLLLIVLEAGLPGLTFTFSQNKWATYVLYAFVAGFSEAFVIGLAQHLATIGDQKTESDSEKKNR